VKIKLFLSEDQISGYNSGQLCVEFGGTLMIVIDGMGGLVGWTRVRGVRVAVYSADLATIEFEDSEGMTWKEAEQVIEAAEEGLAEAVEEGDIRAAPIIVRSADEEELKLLAKQDGDK